jgi:N-acylglucosamine-6-phosphate 2-epimerase
MKLDEVLTRWQGGLIVSCQAAAGSPLSRPDIIAAMALTAEQNGAVGVRIDGASNIRAVRKLVRVPVIGIEKMMHRDSDVYITPTYESAMRIAASNPDVIAVDGTRRARPNDESLGSLVSRIHKELNLPVMADVATLEEGIMAVEEAGANLVSTTLSGYTLETAGAEEPDLHLVERLANRLSVPVICEGRLRSTSDARRAFENGAFAIVVGTAITGVDWLVRHYAAATPLARQEEDSSEAATTGVALNL